jgi:DNA-directed RNA polymerase specialized sigma24 family protein
MSSSPSVTQWLGRIQAGDREAAQRLWERYFEQLVRLARAQLYGARRRAADEEDVALSAFDSFIRRAEQGRFPGLHDRYGLWPLLAKITKCKAIKLVEHERTQRQGGGKVRGESALAAPDGDSQAGGGWQEVLGGEPSPAFVCQVAEEFRLLLDRLPDPNLRQVALWKLEGYTNAEIAGRLGCVESTVERKLRVIRTVWEKGGRE